jgi:diadenosine tetraphosphate (Ap4A) HIT family hydrolase
MNINGFTPKQYAHDLAVGWISAIYNRQTSDLSDLTDAQQKAVREQLAKLHERLMNNAKLDGLSLDKDIR